ncbi:MAG: hypothetical protein D6690_14500 [Nitrospirae bacterium]|nr:MAG: hypothetical protein D6690_14500 [Nitrospirota bacterium]
MFFFKQHGRTRTMFLRISLWLCLLILPASAQATVFATLEPGWHRTHLFWAIGPATNFPISELSFDSHGPAAIGRLTWIAPEHGWLIQGQIRGAYHLDGDVTDEDFLFPNHTGLFSRSESRIDGHLGFSLDLDAGWRFWKSSRVWGYFMGGFFFDQQRFRITDGVQVVPDSGAFAGLNSDYRARWYGPSVGLRLLGLLRPLPFHLELQGRYYPHTIYRGRGLWNLRTDFAQSPSFEHEATGHGGILQLHLRWPFHPQAGLQVGWTAVFLRADEGTDRTFFADGTQDTTGLLEVSQDQHVFAVGLLYRF